MDDFTYLPVVEPLYNSHLGDRRKWPLWVDGRYGEVANKKTIFRSVKGRGDH